MAEMASIEPPLRRDPGLFGHVLLQRRCLQDILEHSLFTSTLRRLQRHYWFERTQLSTAFCFTGKAVSVAVYNSIHRLASSHNSSSLSQNSACPTQGKENHTSRQAPRQPPACAPPSPKRATRISSEDHPKQRRGNKRQPRGVPMLNSKTWLNLSKEDFCRHPSTSHR